MEIYSIDHLSPHEESRKAFKYFVTLLTDDIESTLTSSTAFDAVTIGVINLYKCTLKY